MTETVFTTDMTTHDGMFSDSRAWNDEPEEGYDVPGEGYKTCAGFACSITLRDSDPDLCERCDLHGARRKHITTVSQQVHNKRRKSTYGKWMVDCSVCGTDIVPAQDYEGDAEAIATRHQEIGGYG